jgi:hypothetical protein
MLNLLREHNYFVSQGVSICIVHCNKVGLLSTEITLFQLWQDSHSTSFMYL